MYIQIKSLHFLYIGITKGITMNTTTIIKCFAVTNHYEIMPLKEINRTIYDDGDLTKIDTEICDNVKSQQRYYISQHRIKFSDLWLDDDGKPDNGNVFMTLQDAKKYATQNIHRDIGIKQSEIERLNETLKEIS